MGYSLTNNFTAVFFALITKVFLVFLLRANALFIVKINVHLMKKTKRMVMDILQNFLTFDENKHVSGDFENFIFS